MWSWLQGSGDAVLLPHTLGYMHAWSRLEFTHASETLRRVNGMGEFPVIPLSTETFSVKNPTVPLDTESLPDILRKEALPITQQEGYVWKYDTDKTL